MNFVKVIVVSSIVMSIFGCVITGEVKEINKITSSGNYAKIAKHAEEKLKGNFLDKPSEKKNVDLY
jgi:hypothetical protein